MKKCVTYWWNCIFIVFKQFLWAIHILMEKKIGKYKVITRKKIAIPGFY